MRYGIIVLIVCFFTGCSKFSGDDLNKEYKIDDNKYLMLKIVDNSYAYNIETVCCLKNSDILKKLDIPIFDLESNKIVFSASVLGYESFDLKTNTLLVYTKGTGYGGLSTKRVYKIDNDDLVLIQQYGTKDFIDKGYKLNGTESDWYIQYEKKD